MLASVLLLLAFPQTQAAFSGVTGTVGSWTGAADFPTFEESVNADGPWAYHRSEEAATAATTSAVTDSSGQAHPGTYHGATDGPVTWWRFDEAGGTATTDSSGASVTGSLTGGTARVTGKVDQALDFDGATGAVAGSGPATSTAASFTVAAWVRLDATGGDQAALSQDGVNTFGFALGLDAASGKWVLQVPTADVSPPVLLNQYSSAQAAVGQWTHLTGIFRDDVHRLYLYVDGILIGSMDRPSTWAATGALTAGRAKVGGGYGQYFNGAVDDVRVYHRVLSDTEIVAIAMEPPALQWGFDEATGGTTADLTGGNNTGTFGSNTTWDTGRAGHAASFADDGTNGYVLGATSAVHTNASFSVSAWVWLDVGADAAGFRTAVSQRGNIVSAFYLQMRRAPGPVWSFSLPQGDSLGLSHDFLISASAATTGAWTHLVGVYDRAAQTAQLYVNGVSGATAPHTDAHSWDATGPVEIGRARFNSNPVDAWDGKVEDVRIYQRALTAGEITALRADGTSAPMTAGISGALQGTQQGLQSSTAVAFGGSTNASNDTGVTDPQVFTGEAWFKAGPGAGGALLGFSATRTGMQTQSSDRTIYLDSGGHVGFMVSPPGGPTTITATATATDSAWHHVAASLGPAAMRLYLDGELVASNPAVTAAGAFAGYWRWGGLPLDGVADRPASDYVVGALDELAVYPAQLTDVQIRQHFHADH